MNFQPRATATFSSLLHLMSRVCREPLHRGVAQTDADRHVKRHRSANLAMALICHSLLDIPSLRQLKRRLDSDGRLRRHVGLSGISNAQLPQAIRRRPSALWLPLIRKLISQLSAQRGSSALRVVDTSFFAMGAKLFSRIHGKEFKPEAAGMKLGMVIDPANDAPVRCDLRVGQSHDLDHVGTLIPPEIDIEGLTYIFDAGFLKFDFYADLIERKAHFITRAQKRVKYQILSSNPLESGHPEIVADDIVSLGSEHSRNRLRHRIRRIEIGGPKGGLTLWSSDLDRPAHEIADLYRQRWQIEVVFRWIKSTIGCVRPLGYSQNAAEHSLYAALVAYLICAILADRQVSKATKRLTARLANAVGLIKSSLYAKPNRKQLLALGFT